jgi:hypothetical protein
MLPSQVNPIMQKLKSTPRPMSASNSIESVNLSNLFTGDLSSLAYVDTNDQPTFWSTQSACTTGFDCIRNQSFFKLVRPYFEQTIPVNAHMQRALFDVAGNPTNIYMELAKAYAMSLQGE